MDVVEANDKHFARIKVLETLCTKVREALRMNLCLEDFAVWQTNALARPSLPGSRRERAAHGLAHDEPRRPGASDRGRRDRRRGWTSCAGRHRCARATNCGSTPRSWRCGPANLTTGTWRAIADLTSVENLAGTAYDDQLRGDGGSNGFLSYTGGHDLLDGRGGTDTADFSHFGSAVWVDLTYADAQAWTKDQADLTAGTWRRRQTCPGSRT